jgi:hypothetical protein
MCAIVEQNQMLTNQSFYFAQIEMALIDEQFPDITCATIDEVIDSIDTFLSVTQTASKFCCHHNIYRTDETVLKGLIEYYTSSIVDHHRLSRTQVLMHLPQCMFHLFGGIVFQRMNQ